MYTCVCWLGCAPSCGNCWVNVLILTMSLRDGFMVSNSSIFGGCKRKGIWRVFCSSLIIAGTGFTARGFSDFAASLRPAPGIAVVAGSPELRGLAESAGATELGL